MALGYLTLRQPEEALAELVAAAPKKRKPSTSPAIPILVDAGLGRLRQKEDRFVFHELRHTFGTLAVRAFPLSDVRAFMGHENIETTMIYVHHLPSPTPASRLSALLTAATAPDPAHAAR
jgi:integrase